uniref:DUF38 domain-containing protein n=1 Tax=Panagrolaimus sp. JU765 TaxID=591449 RepID=A0AC34PY13_9BILA
MYSVCFPVQKKRLWNCSRSSANLGKKPTTLLLSAITDDTEEYFFRSPDKFIDGFTFDGAKNAIVRAKTNRVVMDNLVLNLVGTFDGIACVRDICEDEITETNKFVEFNHFELVFEVGILQLFPQLFTPNVKTVVFSNNCKEPTEDNYEDYNFDIVFNYLRNIEKIEFFYFEMSKLFVKINRDFGPKLAEMRFYFRSKDENYDLLAEIMRKQSSNANFYVWPEQSDDQSLASMLGKR